MSDTSPALRVFIGLLVLGWLVFVAVYVFKIESIKRKDLQTKEAVLAALEQYKPMTITTTLKTDENFMAVLIKKLSDDKDFVAKVAAEAKKTK